MKKILAISILLNIVFLATVIRHFVNKPSPAKNTGYFMNQDKIFKSLPIDSNSIVFIGDSEISGFDFSERFGNLNIKNRGIPYDTSLGELNRIDDVVKGNPSKIFIEGGINDLEQTVPVKKIDSNMRAMVARIKKQSPKTAIYLQSILPTNLKTKGVDELNKWYSETARSMHITFIDLDPTFKANGLRYDSGDGVHVSGEGYKKWTEILIPYIKSP